MKARSNMLANLELLRRVLSAGERDRLADGARDLGVMLTLRDPDQHAAVLDMLHAVEPANEFGRGFVAALRYAIDAFVAALDREAADAELARLADREGVREVLIGLHDGIRLPSQLAERAGCAKSQITALLQALEDRGLVEADPDAEDKRTRPRALTARGLGLARRLAGEAVSPVLADVDLVVRASLECLALLTARQHAARSDLADLLDRRLPLPASIRALAALERGASELGLAIASDATLWHVEARLNDVVADHLQRAIEGSDVALHALLPSLGGGHRLVIRTGQRRDDWCRLKQVHHLDQIDVVGAGEARLDSVDHQAPFDVIYDSGVEVQNDLRCDRRRDYIEPAEQRWLHVLAQSSVPESFQRVLLEG